VVSAAPVFQEHASASKIVLSTKLGIDGGGRLVAVPARSQSVPRDNKDRSESGLAEHKVIRSSLALHKATERRFPVTKTSVSQISPFAMIVNCAHACVHEPMVRPLNTRL
jgi:hypothetical protein